MRDKILNSIGVGLLLLCFIVALGRIVLKKKEAVEKDQVTIRFAHWQLENGPREAFDKIAKEYMKLHPGVKVEQLAIPERIYTNWLLTQLVGGTAPDIIEIGIGSRDELIARYFAPIGDLAQQPNPYNKGTDLEGVPLRDTFFDGMEGGFNINLLDYYAVPVSGASIRMYVNLDLLKAVTGSEELPKTYEQFIDVCKKALEYSKQHNVPLVPIAGSKYNAPLLMDMLFTSQTQKLARKTNPVGLLDDNPVKRARDYVNGVWSLETAEIKDGFDLVNEVGQYMQPGFIQAWRDDASLLFVQQRALFISSGSWDATSIRHQAEFKVGVFPLPIPEPGETRYGKNVLGVISEAGANAALPFGITRESPNPEVARDFLLFFVSKAMNQIWTDESGWIPAVVGVTPSKEAAPFTPIVEGYLPGFNVKFGGGLFADVLRHYNKNFHLLVDPHGGREVFVNAIKGEMIPSIKEDAARGVRNTLDIVRRGDTQAAALAWMAEQDGGDSPVFKQFDNFMQSSALNQRRYFQLKMLQQEVSKK